MVKRMKGACAKNKERKAAELAANDIEKAVAAIAKTTGDAGESEDPFTADVEEKLLSTRVERQERIVRKGGRGWRCMLK